jgi:hypothetical protein
MAAESCDYQLAADLAASCTVKPVKGIKSHGFIMNYNDIDFEATARDATNPNIVKSLILKTGKKAYKMYVPGKSPYTGTKKSLSAGTYRNRFNKDVSIVILDNGPEVAHNIIDQLANGTFVVVLENKFPGSDNKNTFEIYGLEAGLTATAMDDDKYSDDTEGGWLATLQEENAPTSGIYLYSESIAATRTALESLVSGS